MDKKEVIKRFKKSLFFKAFETARLNKKQFLLTLVFDFLFIITLYYSSQFASSFITIRINDIIKFLALPLLSIIFALLFVIAYFFLLILIYSFFKYCILDIIKSMTEKTDFEFKRFSRFYLLNLVTWISFLLILFIVSIVLSLSIKQQYLPVTGMVIFIPLVLVFYSFLNFSHSYFVLEPMPIKAVLKHSFKKILNLSSYYKVYLASLLYSLAYFIVYFPVALLFKTIFSQRADLLRYYPLYVKIFTVITLIVIYLIIAYNRIYFYLSAKEAKQ